MCISSSNFVFSPTEMARPCEPSTLPLIQHWTSKAMKDRLVAEASADHFGQGEWISDTYPISRRTISDQEPVEVDTRPVEVDAQGSGADERCVIFHIPSNEKSDVEILQIAKDPTDAASLKFKRNLALVTNSYVREMKSILRKDEDVVGDVAGDADAAAGTSSRAPAPDTTHATTPAAVPNQLHDSDDEFFTDADLLQTVDSIVLEFLDKAKKKKKKKEKKKYFDDDESLPKFNLLTPTPPVTDNSQSSVQGEEENVITMVSVSTTPEVPEEETKWPFNNDIFWSGFMKKNARHLEAMDHKQKNFVDFCFYHHQPAIENNVFSHQGEYYVPFEYMQTLNNDLIECSVIDAWAFMLNKLDFTDVDGQAYRFSTQHSDALCKLHKCQDKTDEAAAFAKNVRDYWVFNIEKFKNLHHSDDFNIEQFNAFFSRVHRLFFPICYGGHYFAAVVDFSQKKFFYLDNRSHGTLERNIYFQLAALVHVQCGIFLKDMGHPNADEVQSYPIEYIKFKWQKSRQNIDCGVFVMNYMENFKGYAYDCPELDQQISRTALRAIYCSQIILSPFNHERSKLEVSVIEFVNRMLKKSGN